jgi:metallo-beta-lactamase family protein
LGAGVVSLYIGGKKVVFSGDLGRKNDEILFDPTKIKTADYILCETTYGNRKHKDIDSKEELAKIINMTMSKGGSVIIPAFAVGRCQLILYYIYQLRKEGKIPFIPVFVDSPMSIKVTHLLDDFAKEHKLSLKECMEIYEETRFTTTVEQSKRIFDYMKPKIIISASGMASGGRVLHHLAHYAPYRENTIVLVGYQSIGTRGRQLQEGERELKIHGEDIQVNCDVVMLDNMSAHSDSDELMEWLSSFKQKPKKLFLVHGEKKSMEAFQERVENELNWDVEMPEYLQIRQL